MQPQAAEKSVSAKKLIWRCKVWITVLRRFGLTNVKPNYRRTNLPNESIRTKLARFLLKETLAQYDAPLLGCEAHAGEWSEQVTGRHRKLGGLADESVRGAQRGLLVLLGSALIWALLIWAGYNYFT